MQGHWSVVWSIHFYFVFVCVCICVLYLKFNILQRLQLYSPQLKINQQMPRGDLFLIHCFVVKPQVLGAKINYTPLFLELKNI